MLSEARLPFAERDPIPLEAPQRRLPFAERDPIPLEAPQRRLPFAERDPIPPAAVVRFSAESGEDPNRDHLATYVDATHAILFDAGDEEIREVERMGAPQTPEFEIQTARCLRMM